MATDQEHECCLSCTLLASMEPVGRAPETFEDFSERYQAQIARALDLPPPTTGSIVLSTERGRVLRVEDLGPAGEPGGAV